MATPNNSFTGRLVKKVDKSKVKLVRQSAPDVPTRYSVMSILSEVLMVVERVCTYLEAKAYLDVISMVPLLMTKLRAHGLQLEELSKHQLDTAFVTFRNASMIEEFSSVVRLSLLFLVELRAMNWQCTNDLITYYSNKSVPVEASEIGDTLSGTIMPTPMPLLLNPGEVLKPSGKFASPTKMPGKSYCKDEVVIRNADSGKVMGIKGRRVHMIEELSETVISFQRVNPGAKERLVQITGPTEEKIDVAKHLMEETIRRNASPVREVADNNGSNSSLNSSTSDESNRLINSGSKLQHQMSTGDAGMFEYKHTVNVGENTVHVSSVNLELLRQAKILLDNHLGNETAEKKRAEDKRNIVRRNEEIYKSIPYLPRWDPDVLWKGGENACKPAETPLKQTEKRSSLNNSKILQSKIDVHSAPLVVHSEKSGERGSGKVPAGTFRTEPSTESVESDDEAPTIIASTVCTGNENTHTVGAGAHVFIESKVQSKERSSKEIALTPVLPPNNVRPKLEYSRQFLLDCSVSFASHQTPHLWDKIAREYPLLVKQVPPMACPDAFTGIVIS